ncbi:alpha/beta hydrolase [uncultured Pseudoteredinibacter sp.]|uniref:alpha/beta fold hydrolase n=1 Tax=uncultured Pseudoteredinibacter sp. TaxID=1641701 RepID=UPI0026296F87|nr:alpha/beta hydrolase [uncultured Pseudoteredinibacter sp.]
MYQRIKEIANDMHHGKGHFNELLSEKEGAETIHFYHATGYPFGSYADLLSRLADDYNIFGLAHRGCWEDQAEPNSSIAWHNYADDLIEFLDRQKRGPVIGMGHSIGGVTTMFAAIKRPDLFSKIVLIDPVFVAPPLWYMSRLARLLNKPVPMAAVAKKRPNQWASREEAVNFHRSKRAFSRFTEKSMEAYGHFGIKETDKGFGLRFSRDWEAHIYSSVPYIWRQLPKLKLPVLGLRGEFSDVLMDKSWGRWQKLRPQDQLFSLSEAGHMLPHERPLECAEHIKEFLSR